MINRPEKLSKILDTSQAAPQGLARLRVGHGTKATATTTGP